MSLEANRKTAIRLLQGLAEGDLDWSLFSEDAVWWIPGRPEMPIAQFQAPLKAFLGGMAGGGRIEIHGITAEPDRIALETESFFPTKDGRTYNNTYHFLVEFRAGKVTRVKEYCDTAYVRSFFGG
jgi:ketosteroid isomerase-like protein